MKTEAKITNRMIRLKESLGPKKLRMLYVCSALFGLVVLLFAYCPLMGKLHTAANRLGEVQAELLSQQSAIAASDNSNVKGELIRQDDLSLAIAELTEKGRSLGLQFSSIAQQQLQDTTQAGIQKLPISFMIDSEYKNIGLFLAYIEDPSGGITEIESLSICPSENDSTKLSVKLVLNLYVKI